MCRRTMAVFLWPVWAILSDSVAPLAAAAVARPERREWPKNCRASRPAVSAECFTTEPPRPR